MDVAYDDSDLAAELAGRAHDLMEEVVIPTEREHLGDGPVPTDVIDDLRAEARDYGIYAPQVAEEYGGMGVSFRDALTVFEEAGRSMLGPAAMRVDAPDEGVMHLLELVGTEAQREEYLRPMVPADVRSAFSMTEPMQGGGADPKMVKTTAERDGDEWVIDGHKTWTSQGSVADFLVVLARTDQEAHPYQGCTLFIVPADADGVTVERDIPHISDGLVGMTHDEILYEGVRVPHENVLGSENDGFKHAQQRLGPARLTHCMRYSGRAQRALDVAKAYVSEREAFDEPIAEKQSVRFEVAEAETKLHAARCMVRHAARQIEQGNEARTEVSMCKIFAAEATQEVIDRAVQFCGATGIGKDLPIADFYENVRRFRIVDGPDEVHKRVIAREAFDDVDASEIDGVPRFRG